MNHGSQLITETSNKSANILRICLKLNNVPEISIAASSVSTPTRTAS